MKHRKGFIHLALHHGANLVPAFGFGELSLFSQLANPRGSTLRRVQDVLQRWMGFAAPMLWGEGGVPVSVGDSAEEGEGGCEAWAGH